MISFSKLKKYPIHRIISLYKKILNSPCKIENRILILEKDLSEVETVNIGFELKKIAHAENGSKIIIYGHNDFYFYDSDVQPTKLINIELGNKINQIIKLKYNRMDDIQTIENVILSYINKKFNQPSSKFTVSICDVGFIVIDNKIYSNLSLPKATLKN